MQPPIVMAVTGASGAIYARCLLAALARAGRAVHLIVSPMGRRLLAEELDLPEPAPAGLIGQELAESVRVHPHDELGAAIASGSYLTAGMVICPCSSNTLAAVAAGQADNLVTRAAAVALKERRRLVLATRETPLSLIEIENMARVTRAGGVVCPASPPFYLRPRTIDALVEAYVARLLDLLGVAHDLNHRYDP